MALESLSGSDSFGTWADKINLAIADAGTTPIIKGTDNSGTYLIRINELLVSQGVNTLATDDNTNIWLIRNNEAITIINQGGGAEPEYALISDGNQYIDTGIHLDSDMDFEYECYGEGTTKHSSELVFFGANETGYPASDGGIGLYRNDVNTTYIYWGDHSGSYGSILNNQEWNKIYKEGNVFGRITATDDWSTSYTATPFTHTTTTAILFGHVDGNDVWVNKGSSSYLKIWSDATRDTLVLDLKAVPSGSQLHGASTTAPSNCMYDVVSDTYFENQGTGTFGIEEIRIASPGQFALTSSNEQVINTEILLRDAYDFELPVNPTHGANNYIIPFGSVIGGYPNADTAIGLYGDQQFLRYITAWGAYQFHDGTSHAVDSWQLWGKADRSAYITINGVDKIRTTVGTTPDQTVPAGLFGNSSVNAPLSGAYFAGSIGGLKIWDDATRSTLLCNMIAVPAGWRGEAGSPVATENCMWCTVRKQYFYNQGTGSFGIEEIV
jgi:hypothetical protein